MNKRHTHRRTQYVPCPDCGTLLTLTSSKEVRVRAWKCPACGLQWNDKTIKLAYRLMGLGNDDSGKE